MSERSTAERDYRTRYLKLRSVLHDRTTELPAFPLLFDRLRAWLDDRRVVGLLHVDVAELEMVESLYGWQVFDGIVRQVASTLRTMLAEQFKEDAELTLNGVAGDRFVIFVRNQSDGRDVDGAYLAQLGMRLTRGLEVAFDDEQFAGINPGLRFRAGHALLSENPFYRFERCVYAAIESARAIDSRREQRREKSWADELRGIIRHDSLRTLFQPVVELESRRVMGHESLARGPQHSMFETPRTLFEMSDRIGVGGALDRSCYRKALSEFVGLQPRGRLFLNLRRDSIAVGLEAMEQSVEEYGLRAADVVIEVSDREAAEAPEDFARQLRRVKQAGFGLALDDVGTGRTRMEWIQAAAPDYLKVDGCLIRHIESSLMQQELLVALAEIAERVGGAVIGEAVESADEARVLFECGARYGQGHYFAAPAAARRNAGSGVVI